MVFLCQRHVDDVINSCQVDDEFVIGGALPIYRLYDPYFKLAILIFFMDN